MRRDVAIASVLQIRDRLAFQVEWSPFVNRPVPRRRGVAMLSGAGGRNPVNVGRELRRSLRVSALLLDGGSSEEDQASLVETRTLFGVESDELMWPQIAMAQVFVSPPRTIDVHAVTVGPSFPLWQDIDRLVRSLSDPDFELGDAVLRQLARSGNSATFPHAS